MDMYIGIKQIAAKPIKLGKYNDHRGWTIPPDEDPERDGFLITYPDGYVSWSPKEVFDAAYRKNGELDYGMALFLLKQGKKLQRAGWNGKGMFIYLVPANEYPADGNKLGTMKGVFPGDMVPYGPYLAMKTAQDNVVPWLCSQTDALAEDWSVID